MREGKPTPTSLEILLPIYGTIYISAGPAEHRGEVRSDMLRLLEAGLHSPEHVLFIIPRSR